MKTNNKTPLPWYTRPTGGGSQQMIASETDPSGTTVAVIYTGTEDAALIVRAVNSHAELVALARSVAAWDGPQYAASRALGGFAADARDILSKLEATP